MIVTVCFSVCLLALDCIVCMSTIFRLYCIVLYGYDHYKNVGPNVLLVYVDFSGASDLWLQAT